jgi:translation initiation factor IF-2
LAPRRFPIQRGRGGRRRGRGRGRGRTADIGPAAATAVQDVGRPNNRAAASGPLELPTAMSVRQLAELLLLSPVDVIKQLMRKGFMANVNEVLDFETAATTATELGFDVKRQPEERGSHDLLTQQPLHEEEDPENLQLRPPVVTIMGHVDHGKTSLLDAIRKTNVATREVGGITQHIGAYQVEYKDSRITFLDTPGHEAFTAMRARGARATDIAILVVAADDGIMPQTEEAIDHAKAAGVPILVAINKIDLPAADSERVKRQLAERDLLPEEWGGTTVTVAVSASQDTGINDLLDNLSVLAEIGELKANPNRPALGVVIEAELDKSKGPLATVLVQQGTLRIGDNVVVGTTWGRIKAMIADNGSRTREAGPSLPVEILGLDQLPQAGDSLSVVASERTAKEIVEERRRLQGAEQASHHFSLEEVLTRIQSGEVKELPAILKCDAQGSVDAVRNALSKIGSTKARLTILHSGAGTINESDVLLAIASKAIIIGFNTRLEPGARHLAEQEKIQVRQHDIIYRLVEEMEQTLEGLLEATERIILEGRAEVRAVFTAGRKVKAAGCLVTEGKLTRGTLIRVLRGGTLTHESRIAGLRRFKDDVREVTNGFECGVTIEGFSDFEEGDVLEVYRVELEL